MSGTDPPERPGLPTLLVFTNNAGVTEAPVLGLSIVSIKTSETSENILRCFALHFSLNFAS